MALCQHEIQIRVRYCETDAMGFLHHANYLNYFEIGRTELFRAQGGNYREMEERGLYLVVVQFACRYHKPARYLLFGRRYLASPRPSWSTITSCSATASCWRRRTAYWRALTERATFNA